MKKERKLVNGFILLRDKSCDFEAVKNNLKEDWSIDISNEKVEENNLIFHVGDTMSALSFIPVPIPNGEAEENASHNYLWSKGVEETKKHQAQIVVAVFDENPYTASKIFNKVVSSTLKLDNVIGIYKYPTVIPPDQYIEVAEYLKDGELPLANMVYIGLYNSEKGISGFSEGISFFGKKEIEVLDTSLDPFDLYNFLYDIIYYVLNNDIELKDGETIGFSEEQKLPITISKGIAVEGETIKIAYDVIKN